MKKIRINFSDFWPGFNPWDNYFTNLLRENYEVEISNNPDFLFYSIFGNNHYYYNCTKIQYLGENIAPDLHYSNWAMSFDYLKEDNHYRLPHYLLYDGYYDLVNKQVDEKLLDRKFCSYVVSNGGCVARNNFFEKLSRYKKVDSGGRFNNNIGKPIDNKVQWLKEYKFNICFENDAHRSYNEHYTTEKLMEACVANTMGIYLGNTQIHKEFNTKSFVNIRDFKNEDEAIAYIIDLDQNDDKYMQVMKQPWFPNENSIPEDNRIENIKKFLENIFG